jgi:hypothetical protein
MQNAPTPFFSDFVACQKIITRKWTVNLETGQIFADTGKEIMGTLNSGYLLIGTSWYGQPVNIMKHRAIVIGSMNGIVPDPEMQIDHIDGNKTDNRMSNLRVVTARENCANANAPNVKYGEGNPNALLTNNQADEIRRMWAETRQLPKGGGRITQRQLAFMYGVPQSSIYRILRGSAYPTKPQEAEA